MAQAQSLSERDLFKVPEAYRHTGQMAQLTGIRSSVGDRFGIFVIPVLDRPGTYLTVIASDGENMGWEHVSVTRRVGNQVFTPTWDDMARVKDLFWHPEATVYQLHPPHSEYVNNHPNCLHLWRKVGFTMPLPDSVMVGLKSLNKTSG